MNYKAVNTQERNPTKDGWYHTIDAGKIHLSKYKNGKWTMPFGVEIWLEEIDGVMCPFCKEEGFDIEGLRQHLKTGGGVFSGPCKNF
jgi:hypothetical protein